MALGDEAERLARNGKSALALDLDGAYVDVLEFDRLVQLEDSPSWEKAVALYRAPLLAGWSDPWVVEHRARRKRSFDRVLRLLVEEALGEGRCTEAETWIRQAADLAPGDEEWGRRLLHVLALQGHFNRMETAYEQLRAEIKQVGCSPSEETERLIADLRREAKQPRSAQAPVPEPEPKAVQVTAERRQVALLYKRNADPDEAVMRLLTRELGAAGYTVFTDRHLQSGVEWAREIERQVRDSYAVIPLISRAAVGSDMLEYEIEIAYQAAQTRGGLPRLLPVRINYEDPLPSGGAMAAILDPLQYVLWRGPQDDARLITALEASLSQPLPIVTGLIETEPAGGAVPIDSPFYIERSTDGAFQQAIRRRHSIVLVKGARQIGKTSLLARGMNEARHLGVNVVRTDLQKLNRAQLQSPTALLFSLATTLARQLNLPPPELAKWDSNLGANAHLEEFLFYDVLEATDKPLVWVLDEVDRLFATPYGDEVFGLFRSWHNERSLDPRGPCSRLTLAIAYATEAHLFISDINQSPFNVGTRLSLADFTLEQVTELNRRYGSPLTSEPVVDRFYHLVNGQPYLTRRGLNDMVESGLKVETLEDLSARDEGPFGDHLRRILATVVHDPTVTDVVRGLLRGDGGVTQEMFYRLRSAGVLADGPAIAPRFRCAIYATYLTRHLL
jgi:DNA-binding SARP family transcriptional activator